MLSHKRKDLELSHDEEKPATKQKQDSIKQWVFELEKTFEQTVIVGKEATLKKITDLCRLIGQEKTWESGKINQLVEALTPFATKLLESRMEWFIPEQDPDDCEEEWYPSVNEIQKICERPEYAKDIAYTIQWLADGYLNQPDNLEKALQHASILARLKLYFLGEASSNQIIFNFLMQSLDEKFLTMQYHVVPHVVEWKEELTQTWQISDSKARLEAVQSVVSLYDNYIKDFKKNSLTISDNIADSQPDSADLVTELRKYIGSTVESGSVHELSEEQIFELAYALMRLNAAAERKFGDFEFVPGTGSRQIQLRDPTDRARLEFDKGIKNQATLLRQGIFTQAQIDSLVFLWERELLFNVVNVNAVLATPEKDHKRMLDMLHFARLSNDFRPNKFELLFLWRHMKNVNDKSVAEITFAAGWLCAAGILTPNNMEKICHHAQIADISLSHRGISISKIEDNAVKEIRREILQVVFDKTMDFIMQKNRVTSQRTTSSSSDRGVAGLISQRSPVFRNTFSTTKTQRDELDNVLEESRVTRVPSAVFTLPIEPPRGARYRPTREEVDSLARALEQSRNAPVRRRENVVGMRDAIFSIPTLPGAGHRATQMEIDALRRAVESSAAGRSSTQVATDSPDESRQESSISRPR